MAKERIPRSSIKERYKQNQITHCKLCIKYGNVKWIY